MSRPLNSVTYNVLDNEILTPRIMIAAVFDNPVFIWTGDEDITYNGFTYLGQGSVISFDGVEESNDLGATNITLGLAISSNNLTSDILERAITDDYQGNSITIMLALISNSGVIYGQAITLFDGFIDVMTAEDDGEIATVTLTAESSLVRLGRTFTRVYTDEDQRHYFPGDKGLEFIAAIQEKESIWGRNA